MLYMGTGLATTILVAVIKAHRSRKTNLNAKSNPNPDLQKTCKKKLKEKRKKIITRTAGFELMSSWLNKHGTKTTWPYPGIAPSGYSIHYTNTNPTPYPGSNPG